MAVMAVMEVMAVPAEEDRTYGSGGSAAPDPHIKNANSSNEGFLSIRVILDGVNAVHGRLFLLRGQLKERFVEENQKNISLNVQNIQFWN